MGAVSEAAFFLASPQMPLDPNPQQWKGLT